MRLLRRPTPAEPERPLLNRIRWGLTAWYLALLLCILAVLGAATYFSLQRRLLADLSERLEVKARQEAVSPGVQRMLLEGTHQPPQYEHELRENLLTYVVNPAGKTVSSDLPLPYLPVRSAVHSALAGRSDFRLITPPDAQGHYAVFTQPVRRDGRIIGAVQVAGSTNSDEHALGDLLEIFLLVGATSVILAMPAGMFLAGRALSPIRQSLARQRDFVADASHELRTPLTILQAGTELALQSQDPPEYRETLEHNLRQAQHMARLVADLSTLARSDSGQVILEEAQLDLVPLLQETLNQVRPLADTKEIILSHRWSASLPVHGDRQRLGQLFLILLDNAIKYTPAGGKVTVSAAALRKSIARVTVSDTGIGIPAQDLPLIFERFYRVDKARSREEGGTGLGLSIARWIARAHGGEITAVSTEGQGSTFTVQLPLTK